MKRFLKTKDFSVSGEEFELLLDTELNMLRTHPEPKHLENYYNSEAYISHTDSAKTLVDKLYQHIKKHNLRKKVSLINKYTTSDKTLLDIGTGTGSFLESAKYNGWETYGIEPNKKARDFAGKANLLDENIAETHLALANSCFWYDWDFEQTARSIKKAMQLSPGTASIHGFNAVYCWRKC